MHNSGEKDSRELLMIEELVYVGYLLSESYKHKFYKSNNKTTDSKIKPLHGTWWTFKQTDTWKDGQTGKWKNKQKIWNPPQKNHTKYYIRCDFIHILICPVSQRTSIQKVWNLKYFHRLTVNIFPHPLLPSIACCSLLVVWD